MRPEEFLYNLHFDIDKISPPDHEVDWEDAPLAYKLYRGLPVVPLSAEVPLSLEGQQSHPKPGLPEIGHFLWYVYGLTQCCQNVDAVEPAASVTHSYRRFVPSGGALYPNELYIYLKVEDLTTGIYHYDVAHHRLVLLRAGDFDSYLDQALGSRCDVSTCFGIVFVSTLFWKNFFKYNNFSYRLQALDAGVLIGQLLEVAKRFRYETGVYFQFLDRAVNHLLGLSMADESAYAVIPLSVEPEQNWFANEVDNKQFISADELCRTVSALQQDHFIRSKRISDYPLLKKLNEVCVLDTSSSFHQIHLEKQVSRKGQKIVLPPVKRISFDLAEACRKRHSPGMDFILEKVQLAQLAAMLQESTSSFKYRNDLDARAEQPQSRVSLCVCLSGVEGISNGAYDYDSHSHALRLIRAGDHRFSLQQGMTFPTVNLFQVPFCFHVAGDQDHLQNELGYRGYRIQQMEAGMLVQRLLLAASALGLGGHPLLGFDAGSTDDLYQMALHGGTSLIEIPVGPYRVPMRLQGSLQG